ncbi:MAG: DUF3347 domain-containing protein [Mucilaginibacter sp.]
MKKLTILLLIIFSAALGTVKAVTPALTEDVNNVIKNYLALKNALVIDNAPVAQACAATLLAAISTVSDKEMNAAQRKTWLAYADKLSFDSRHISETTDIDHQREHFANLSVNILAVLKALKLNTATLYKQYCPMKKKYWLSEASAIKNPYYGSKMPTCGETKETLQAVKL